ncbi:MAG: helix-turn-helix domain-containing protein [Phascolarctobacterium sp.]
MIKLREIRLAKGISKYRIAKETGMQYQTIDAVEKGGDLRISTLIKIAKVLDVDIKDLL